LVGGVCPRGGSGIRPITRTDPARAAVEDRAARGGRLQTITYDEALRDKLIVGSPERVTDRLMGLQETLGLDGILCEMTCGTKIPHERVMIVAAPL
jgi:alkanesulfonate monooxygenase SsuD/methylene tetrahydromethanopterin reductase-like flavin-dependent oxidoreductase (luciferase family)